MEPEKPKRLKVIRDLHTHDEPFIVPLQLQLYLQVGRRTMEKWIENGQLPIYDFGDRLKRIRLADAIGFVDKHRLDVAKAS
jgi:excisionase family DNA binding protein